MATAKIHIALDHAGPVINPNIYGHFAEHLGACIYEGAWCGEDSAIPNIGGIRRDVVEALAHLHPPVVRWPGGCFTDFYHWADGIGPRSERPRRVNIWWGETVEYNHFGTDEFIRFCRLIGAQPYFCGNVGSGTPEELMAWLEYCNFAGDSTRAQRRAANGSPEPFGVRYWGVGNENWGCGGNFTPDDYATEYRRFSTYMRDISGTLLTLIACGPSGNDHDWTRRFFTKLGKRVRLHGYAAHFYCGTAGTATEYTVDQWYQLISRAVYMEQLVVEQRAIMDEFDPERKVALLVDEWGTWHPASPGRHPRHLWQQNTIRDALVAAATLDIFNRHADKVQMANIAQTINVLQAMVLTHENSMVLTPTYHVYDMYQYHQGGQQVPATFEADEISFDGATAPGRLFGLSGSCSVRDHVLTLSVVNPHATSSVEAVIDLGEAQVSRVVVSQLAGADIHAHNTFEDPEVVRPTLSEFSAGDAKRPFTLPPASVTVLRFALG